MKKGQVHRRKSDESQKKQLLTLQYSSTKENVESTKEKNGRKNWRNRPLDSIV